MHWLSQMMICLIQQAVKNIKFQKVKIFIKKKTKNMNDKSKLIDSMTSLIQHISISRKNQQQIFATLSISDIRKILSNLEDSNESMNKIKKGLRKTTLSLLSQLLYQNPALQRRFCELTSTPDFPGKIVLSQRFPKNILYDNNSLGEVIRILKNNSNLKQKGLFWYIDGQTKPRILQIAKRNTYTVDPLYCIVGLWVIGEQKEPSRQSLPSNSYMQPQIVNNPKVRLNKSYHVQNNSLFQFKPQTPMKISMVDQQRTQNNKYYDNNYVEQNITPIQIRSELKNPSKVQTTRVISATERKSYQPIITSYDTAKYIKPTYYNIGQLATTQQYQQPFKLIQSITPSNRINGEIKSYVYSRGEYRKN